MKIKWTSIFLCFIVTNVFSQLLWERTGPVNFTGIQKLPSGSIIVCSDAGSIYKSTNDGLDWILFHHSPSRTFTCVRFADDLHGIAGMENGSVYRTNDGGNTWSEVLSGIMSPVSALAYPVIDTAFIATADGRCLRTTNQGVTWELLNVKWQSVTCKVRKLVFPTARYGFVGGDFGRLFSTIDGGLTWDDKSGPDNKTITALDATLDGKVAYALDSYIYSTLDQVNWKATPFTLGDTLDNLHDLVKIKNDTILIFQSGGKYRITRTFNNKWWADRLLPWSEIQNPTYSFNIGVKFNDIYYDDNTGVGIAVGSSGTMYKLTDFGRNAELIRHCNIGDEATTAWLYLEGLENKPNVVHGIAHDGETFVHSSDGGMTWLTRTEKNYGFASYMGLHFKDDSSGIIFTSLRKKPVSSGFLNTTNNGASWGYDTDPPRDNMYSVTYSSTGKLYITADSVIYRSLDDGFTWDTLWNFTNSFFDTSLHKVRFMLRSATFLNNDQDIFVETWAMDSVFVNPVNGGRITHSLVLASSDGGQSWGKRFSFPQIHTLKGMRFITPQLGYAETYFTPVKDSNKTMIWRTIDGV